MTEGYPYITVEADRRNAIWIASKAFEIVDRTKLSMRTDIKAGESIDLTFILAYAAGVATPLASRFGGQIGDLVARDLYGYIKKRIRAVEQVRLRKPNTRQKVRIAHYSNEWDAIIEESESRADDERFGRNRRR
jgi:hypothetical protein